jgi:ABC-type polysaccharide/polyol phosphate export permease
VTWQLIAGCLTEAPAVFYRQESLIKNQRIPTFSLSLQLVLRQVVNFAHNSIVILAIVAFYEPAGLLYLPLALLGAVLVALTLWGLAQAVGYLGARYRDIEPLVISFLPILFFLSPVLYTPQQIGARSSIILFNPAAYWISVIRDPLLGKIPPLSTYVWVALIAAAIWLIALQATQIGRRKLPYWI